MEQVLWWNHGLRQDRSIIILCFAGRFQIFRDAALTFISTGKGRDEVTSRCWTSRNLARFERIRLPVDLSGFKAAVAWVSDRGRGARGRRGVQKVLADADRSRRARHDACRRGIDRGG